MTNEHQQVRELLGAYALDQLDGPTRGSVRSHLDGCAECRSELRSLAPVVEALRGLDPDSVEAVPPVQLGDQVVALVSSRQRAAVRRARLRRAAAGALVAASIAVAFATGGWYAGTRLDPPLEDITLQASTAGVRSEAGLVRHTWGTELKLEAATGFTDGATYTVSFLREDGTRVSGGSFLGTGDRPLVCSMNAAIPRDAATEVQISDPRGGVVMEAQLS